jgi:hypothetical protein
MKLNESICEKYCLIFVLWFGWLVQNDFNHLQIFLLGWSTTQGPQVIINMTITNIRWKRQSPWCFLAN